MDSIAIAGIDMLTRIGVTDAERSAPQQITVDIELYTDLSRAGQSDAIVDTIDYAAVVTKVQEAASGERNTMERLAEDIAARLLKTFRPKAVDVSITKNILPGISGATITITRP